MMEESITHTCIMNEYYIRMHDWKLSLAFPVRMNSGLDLNL